MKLIGMLAAATLLASSQLGYSQETDLMSVNVPFAFTAGGVSMPAGRYVISRVRDNNLLRLRTFGHMDIFLPITPVSLGTAPSTSALLFERDARGYTLREIDQEAEIDAAKIVDPGDKTTGAGEQVATVTAPAR